MTAADFAHTVTAVSFAPPWEVVLATGVVAAVIAWPTRWLQLLNVIGTIAHEFGHAAGSIVTGGRVDYLVLSGPDEGETGWTYRSELSNFVSSLAGYCAPPLLGLGGAALLSAGHAAGVLACVVLMCQLVLIMVRDVATFVVVFLLGALCAVMVLFAWTWLVVAVALPHRVDIDRDRSGRRAL